MLYLSVLLYGKGLNIKNLCFISIIEFRYDFFYRIYYEILVLFIVGFWDSKIEILVELIIILLKKIIKIK